MDFLGIYSPMRLSAGKTDRRMRMRSAGVIERESVRARERNTSSARRAGGKIALAERKAMPVDRIVENRPSLDGRGDTCHTMAFANCAQRYNRARAAIGSSRALHQSIMNDGSMGSQRDMPRKRWRLCQAALSSSGITQSRATCAGRRTGRSSYGRAL